MKRIGLAILLALGTVFAGGCDNQATPENKPPSNDNLQSTNTQPQLPTQAQPKLPAIKIYLGAETLDAEQALTQREVMTGMMFRTNIQDTDAMLFVFPEPYQVSFWMKNCPESISAAYIDPAGVIREIHHLEKQDTNGVVAASGNIQFVLETSDGWFQRHHVSVGAVIRTEKGTLQQTYFPNRQ
jgi:uncharacterized membrane protein (UPF0127 family)